MRIIITIALLASLITNVTAQKQLTPGEIRLKLDQLSVLGSCLYIAAHPDDENTRLIAYLANEKKIRTGYLSLTRGDGGQNLIGKEKGALMGLLRTNELLEARKIDGGEQFFTRAVDFGYSKSPEETFTKWDREKVLEDAVLTIRKFQPDVVVTRFPPTSKAGHGHHSASAMIAAEAIEKAADPTYAPQQLLSYETWAVKRHFFNTSTWWYKDLDVKAADNDSIITVDIGTYNPLLGKSYSEIASASRTMHKSQGFGSSIRRGTKLEYLQLKHGTMPENSMFDGMNLTWQGTSNGEQIMQLIDQLQKGFDPNQPSKSVKDLVQLYELVMISDNLRWRAVKQKEIENLIVACLGFYAEITANHHGGVMNENVPVNLHLISRSDEPVILNNISFFGQDTVTNITLKNNEPLNIKHTTHLPSHFNTHPYWLKDSFESMYSVKKPELVGTPLNSPALKAILTMEIAGMEFEFKRALQYKWTDRVKGERYRPYEILPAVTANVTDPVVIFGNESSKTITVELSYQADAKGQLSLNTDQFVVTPKIANYQGKKGEKQLLEFKIRPPKGGKTSTCSVRIDGTPSHSLTEITYDHIPVQTLLFETSFKLVKLDVQSTGKKVGYINGAGDEVAKSIAQLGYEVTEIDETNQHIDFSQFDVIVAGIRAYNTQPYLAHLHKKLVNFMEKGGTYMVQYNTNRGVETDIMGPYDFKLSRDRVTVEEATATFLSPTHPIMNGPNKLTPADFEGWVQERGLYFPNEWNEAFTPLLGWNDPGEEQKNGALIVADHGEGHFIYTGISFFRQLPAGVPGAFRLLANLLSY